MSNIQEAAQEKVDANISVVLPDGKTMTVPTGTTGGELASKISKSLGNAAIALKVDGKVCDLATELQDGNAVEIITRDHELALELIRHDTAHVMAEAVQILFPNTQVTIGPSIENGFYYDFHKSEPFTPEDLSKIEAKMRDIIAKNENFVREVWSKEQAISFFKEKGELFKVELIEALPEGEPISIYRQGDWLDLCRGPHLPSTGKVGTSFKLMSVAGAYWRGDAKNPMLQRIYGTAWRNQKELDAYLHMLEEAERRDHRRLGKEMKLFHQQEESTGNIFWHPRGWTLFRTIESFLRGRFLNDGYREVKTPILYDSSLFKASGHWDLYGDNMFKVNLGDEKYLGVKPMNCPAHVQIFKQGIKSYRDLPLRLSEFGCCHRNEASGAMHGIMRLRGFTQDDAHIFCREDQITQEALRYFKLQIGIYEDLGFPRDRLKVKLALRPDESKRVGSDELWDKAEKGLRDALEAEGLEYEDLPGEGAFYGPKVEFHLMDAIGRSWQCGTIQLDFNLPERLDAEYVGEDGARYRPVMLHRAILGAIERFIGILIEHYSGKFPMWLAPVQAVVTTITNDADAYANSVLKMLLDKGIRAEIDTRSEKIGYKIREHSLEKIPLLIVVGKKEEESNQVVLRYLGEEQQLTLSCEDVVKHILEQCAIPQRKD